MNWHMYMLVVVASLLRLHVQSLNLNPFHETNVPDDVDIQETTGYNGPIKIISPSKSTKDKIFTKQQSKDKESGAAETINNLSTQASPQLSAEENAKNVKASSYIPSSTNKKRISQFNAASVYEDAPSKSEKTKDSSDFVERSLNSKSEAESFLDTKHFEHTSSATAGDTLSAKVAGPKKKCQSKEGAGCCEGYVDLVYCLLLFHFYNDTFYFSGP